MAGKSIEREALSIRREAFRHDPEFAGLPYLVEINGWGELEASPTGVRHARLLGRITAELARQLLEGEVLTGLAIQTHIGVRVPGVVWASAAFMRAHGDVSPACRAPEICVEIAPGKAHDAQTRDRVLAFLQAGAKEVWTVFSDGRISYFSEEGERATSKYGISVSLPAQLLAK